MYVDLSPIVATQYIHLFVLAGTFSTTSPSTSWPPIPGVSISSISCHYTQVPGPNIDLGGKTCNYDGQGSLIIGPGAAGFSDVSDVSYCPGELRCQQLLEVALYALCSCTISIRTRFSFNQLWSTLSALCLSNSAVRFCVFLHRCIHAGYHCRGLTTFAALPTPSLDFGLCREFA